MTSISKQRVFEHRARWAMTSDRYFRKAGQRSAASAQARIGLPIIAAGKCREAKNKRFPAEVLAMPIEREACT